jgi:uncharacterized protein (DUF1778 family)
MAKAAEKRETAVSMRFRADDLGLIDRGAELAGLSRTVHEAQMAILNETMIRFSPEAYDDFIEAIERPPEPMPPKMIERLRRKPPWERT